MIETILRDGQGGGRAGERWDRGFRRAVLEVSGVLRTTRTNGREAADATRWYEGHGGFSSVIRGSGRVSGETLRASLTLVGLYSVSLSVSVPPPGWFLVCRTWTDGRFTGRKRKLLSTPWTRARPRRRELLAALVENGALHGNHRAQS